MHRCVAILALLAACGGTAAPRPLAVATTSTLPETSVRAIVDLGDKLYVLGDHRVAIYARGSKLAEIAPTPAWRSATTIAAPDHEGRWVVATADTGELWRITALGELEPVGARLGVTHASAILGAGTTTAVALDAGLAVTTDGVHLQRFSTPGLAAVAKNRLARITSGGIELWDLARGTSAHYDVGPAIAVAFLDGDTAHPRLVVATPHAILVQRGAGLVRIASAAPITGATVSGVNVWVSAGGALWIVQGDRLVRTTVAASAQAALTPSEAGDVWVTGPALARYSLAGDTRDPAWQASIGPVFHRVCAHCHLPGGSADLDLSTPGAWTSHAREIIDRVLESRTMPPAGTAFSDEERAVVARWAHGLSK